MKKVIAIDLETHLFEPYNMAPPIVCMSWADGHDSRIVKDTIKESMYYTLKEAIKGNLLIVGHNIAYDMSCIVANYPELMNLVFEAYSKDTITCTLNREKLLDIADGPFFKDKYSLAELTKKHFDVELDKSSDTWRLRYKELERTPVKEWPEASKDYALKDAKFALQLYLLQEKKKEFLHIQFEDVRADFALKLMSTWGIVTNPDRVLDFWNLNIKEQHILADEIQNAGLGRGYYKQLDLFPSDRLREPTITKNQNAIREAVLKNYPGEVPRTDEGAVKTDKETLYECNFESLQKLVKFNELQKMSSTYISKLFDPIIHA
jgi:hypothetical protein